MKINFEKLIKKTLIGKKIINAGDDTFFNHPTVTDVVIIGEHLEIHCGETSYIVNIGETLEIE